MTAVDKEKIINIWKQLLGHDDFTPEDEFFDVGGHSLLATELMISIETAFNVVLPAETIFDHPTVNDLAAVITAKAEAA